MREGEEKKEREKKRERKEKKERREREERKREEKNERQRECEWATTFFALFSMIACANENFDQLENNAQNFEQKGRKITFLKKINKREKRFF